MGYTKDWRGSWLIMVGLIAGMVAAAILGRAVERQREPYPVSEPRPVAGPTGVPSLRNHDYQYEGSALPTNEQSSASSISPLAAVEMVQRLTTKQGMTVQQYFVSKYGDSFGWSANKVGDGVVVEYTAKNTGLSSPTVFRWEVGNGTVAALNGHAISITPDLDITRIRQQQRLSAGTTSREQEIHAFMEARWEYRIERDGAYIPSKHDRDVFEETAKKFGISEREAEAVWDKVEKVLMGLDPTRVVETDDAAQVVDLEISSIGFRNGVFEATVKNNIDKDMPMANLTLELFKSGKSVGFQVIWIEDLGAKEERNYASFEVSRDFDSYQGVVYINVDKLNAAGLRSSLVKATKPGETVLPVLRLPLRKRQ